MAGDKQLIMVVEDDPDLRDLLAISLSRAGYRVHTAENGREALDQIARELPALILLDMKMPIMNGWEFAREFRSRYQEASVPIIVLTAATEASRWAQEIQADAYIDKPFQVKRMLEVVNSFLER